MSDLHAVFRTFVYARMRSGRLPGKPLLEVGGEPLLGRVVRRIRDVSPVVVLTSSDVSDDPIAAWAQGCTVACVRGALVDVAGRTVQALSEYPCEAFFRVNADSPFVLPALLNQGRATWDVTPGLDLVSNVVERTYPYGLAVELVRSSTFVAAEPAMTPEEREHITAHFYRHPDRFRLASLTHPRDVSARRLVVDTAEDLVWLRRTVAEVPDCETWDVDRLAVELP